MRKWEDLESHNANGPTEARNTEFRRCSPGGPVDTEHAHVSRWPTETPAFEKGVVPYGRTNRTSPDQIVQRRMQGELNSPSIRS